MTTARVEYKVNPRFVPDDIPVWFGNSKDAAIIYDNANGELTVQTKNLAGTLTDRIRIEANKDSPVGYFDLLGGVTIGLAASAPAPDGGNVHIWKATAGSVAAYGGSLAIIENNSGAYFSALVPADKDGGIVVGHPSPGSNIDGYLTYHGPSHADADSWWVGINGATTLKYSTGALALQESTTISVLANQTLTLQANAGTTGKIQIDADEVRSELTGGITIGLSAGAPAPDNGNVHIWKGNAGAVAANANSLLTIENSASFSVVLLSPNTAIAGYVFGDPEDNDVAQIIYDHSTDTLSILATAAATGKIQVNADQLGFFGVTPVSRPAAYTPTNVTTDRSYDADASSVAELADVLGTLVADLQNYGLLQ